ncbi:protein FAM234B [Eucyclogobius newberryi]|uniref:protein FAM234B n=1 Tax=Eucyclogobius newberryi TaxID=166745 RepID=UPI003B59FE54
MASALSRALKLPGKKGSELGEYDPLTQADSEDESEEDDLVLSYPRNGLGRDSCLGPGGGRSGRFVGAVDEMLDEEDDDDDWREHVPSLEGDDAKDMQYRDQRRGSGSLVGVHSTDTDAKKMRIKHIVRTAAFLVPLVCATLLVLLCAFLIPCQKGKLRPQWERALGEAGGITPPALALWDVSGDSVAGVFMGVTETPTQGHKVYSAVALSAVSGQIIWKKPMHERVMYIQCGLQISAQKPQVCLLISKSILMAVNGMTGKTVWLVQLKNIESQVVLLPDLQGDLIPDLLISTLPADAAMDLSFTFISGETGEKLGRSVPFNISGQGKLIGPLLHKTQQEAYYILFGLGNIKAIALRDLYIHATGKMPSSQELRKKDSGWEGLKARTNSTTLIHIFGGAEDVTFLYPQVVGYDSNHNNLGTLSNQNSTKSDWVLVYGSSKLSVLRQKDLRKDWTFTSPPIHSQPTSGHFNDDGVLDILLQHSANGIMKVQIIDGATGRLLWSSQFVCPRLDLDSTTMSTSTGQSAFLFWASDPIRGQKNVTKTTVTPGIAAGEPVIRKLFLLHPTYPTVLLELNSTTDTAVTSAVTFEERQEDASYITVSSQPTPASKSIACVVKIMSLKAAIAKAKTVRLNESQTLEIPVKPSAFEVNTFFRRLAFKH